MLLYIVNSIHLLSFTNDVVSKCYAVIEVLHRFRLIYYTISISI